MVSNSFVLTTVSFVFSAVFALRALVATRTWNWSNLHDLDKLRDMDPAPNEDAKVRWRAALLLHRLAFNWEISDLKNRNVDLALRCLMIALVGIAALAAVIASNVA